MLGKSILVSLLLFAVTWAITALEVGLRIWREGEQAIRATGRAAFLGGNVPVRTGMTKVGLPGAKEGWQKTDVTMATGEYPVPIADQEAVPQLSLFRAVEEADASGEAEDA